MGLQLVNAPEEEPVSLAEAKAHLRVTSADEEALISALIVAARAHAEAWTHRCFVTQTWELVLDCFPSWTLEFPNAPLASVESITYVDTAGEEQTLDAAEYQVDTKTDPGRLMPAYGLHWPATREQLNAVTIRFVCGYGDAEDVPAPIKAAILLIVGHLFRNREENSNFPLHELPLGADRLLAPYRVVRF